MALVATAADVLKFALSERRRSTSETRLVQQRTAGHLGRQLEGELRLSTEGNCVCHLRNISAALRLHASGRWFRTSLYGRGLQVPSELLRCTSEGYRDNGYENSSRNFSAATIRCLDVQHPKASDSFQAYASIGLADGTYESSLSERNLEQTYRPKNFDELIGQRSPAKFLKSHAKKGSILPAYLFSGSRGAGKTSAARVFAAAVNCEKLRNGNPCGVCRSCRSTGRGSNTDVREIDAASNSGVESIRALLEGVRYAPQSSRYKVYIIDECHMLSKEAGSALLKTLEEPPSNVVFILVTTDPHKLLDAVVSRCDHHKFGKISEKEIQSAIAKIAEKEKIVVDEAAVQLLAELSQGSLRDALVMLGSMASLGEKVTVKMVEDRFDGAPVGQIVSLLLSALQIGEQEQMSRHLHTVLLRSEPWQVLVSLVQLITEIMCGDPRPQHRMRRSTDEEALNELYSLAGTLNGRAYLARVLCSLQTAELQMRQAPYAHLWLKCTLLQFPIHFVPVQPVLQMHSPFQSLSATATGTLLADGLQPHKRLADVPEQDVSDQPAFASEFESARAEMEAGNLSIEETQREMLDISTSSGTVGEQVTGGKTVESRANEEDVKDDELGVSVEVVAAGNVVAELAELGEGVEGSPTGDPTHVDESRSSKQQMDERHGDVAEAREVGDRPVVLHTGGKAGVADEGIEDEDEADGVEGAEGPVSLREVKARAEEHIQTKSHKSLLNGKGHLISISETEVTLEFPSGCLAGAQKPQTEKSFRRAFSEVLGREISIVYAAAADADGSKRTVASKGPKRVPSRRLKARDEDQKRDLEAAEATDTGKEEANKKSSDSHVERLNIEGSVEEMPKKSRKAEADQFHEKLPDHLARQVWEESVPEVQNKRWREADANEDDSQTKLGAELRGFQDEGTSSELAATKESGMEEARSDSDVPEATWRHEIQRSTKGAKGAVNGAAQSVQFTEDLKAKATNRMDESQPTDDGDLMIPFDSDSRRKKDGRRLHSKQKVEKRVYSKTMLRAVAQKMALTFDGFVRQTSPILKFKI